MTHRSRKPSPPDGDTVTIGADPWEALWAEVDTREVQPSKPEGAGWKSISEVAEARRVDNSTARRLCLSLHQAGLMERAMGRTGINRVATWFYRPRQQHATNGSRK